MTSNGHGGHVTVEGTIEARTDRGIKINGDWINLSKYRPIGMPDAGAHVRVEVDQRGFVCAVEVLTPALESAPKTGTSRDDRITRLAVLKAAASFVGQMAQMHEDAKSDHVIPLAERWLAWVTQDVG